MSSPQAAPRAAAPNATALLALLSPARAAASRKNRAKFPGPKPPGKARSSRNALKHGLCAQKLAVVDDEDPRALAALGAALLQELARQGALETVLARRVVAAAWRLERAERIEAELFAREMHGLFDDGDLGLALIRDGNGARAFDVLLRYRGSALAEFLRALRTLKALQAEAAAGSGDGTAALPNQPESGAQPGKTAPAPAAAPQPAAAGPAPKAATPAGTAPQPRGAALPPQPIEPDRRTNRGESPMSRAVVSSVAVLPAATPLDRRG